MTVIGQLLKWTGAFPVKRGLADREALREARRLVREGHAVGVTSKERVSDSAIRARPSSAG